MAKKGKSGKKKQNKEDKKDSLPEVDKEFYEIRIADLNKKLTRLKSLCAELENEAEDCKKKYKNLDQDRNDIIAYLKRSLSQKQAEVVDFTNRLESMQKEKKTDVNKYEGKIQELERKYAEMTITLTAEITLLNGKLNSLEEFKIQKDSMIEKYLALEEKLKLEAERHLEQEALIENQSLIQKESLRMETEKRLLNLSINLQTDLQNRIANTTNNVVRENIALNNELNLIIVSWQKLFDQNEALKSRLKTLGNEIDVNFDVKNDLLSKHVIQKEVINCLISKYEEVKSKCQEMKSCELNNMILTKKLKDNTKNMNNAVESYKKLEILYHSLTIQTTELKSAFDGLKQHNFKLEERIKEAVRITKDVIGLGLKRQNDPYSISEQDEYSTRYSLLNTLLQLFDDVSLFRSEEVKTPEASQESILATDWRQSAASQQLFSCLSEPSNPGLIL